MTKAVGFMKDALQKMNYRGQDRIAIINADEDIMRTLSGSAPGVRIDTEIDPRYPYDYMIVFVWQVSDIENLAPRALHNLVTDGTLWFAFPKKTSKKHSSDIYNDHGWEVLIDRGFDKVRHVSVNEEWTALRFRNARFIRSYSSKQ